MKPRKTKRKTMKEVQAEARLEGFSACLSILEREWRKRIRLTSKGPIGGEELWPLLEKMQAHQGLLNEDFKILQTPRVWNRSFDRLRKRVEVLHPNANTGRKGFIVDAEAFLENGLHRVFFLDGLDHLPDVSLVHPDQIKRLED